MKFKFFFLVLLVFFPSKIIYADTMCKKADHCTRLYVATGHPSRVGSTYQGVEFPVYLGYFTLNHTQNKLYFTKKTLYDFSWLLDRYKGIIASGIIGIGMLGKPDGNLEKYFGKEQAEEARENIRLQPKYPGSPWNLTFLLERAKDMKVLGYSEDSAGVDPETVNVQFFKQCTYLPNNDPPERCDREEENAFFMMVPNLKITPYEVDINRYKRYLETGEID